MLVVKECVQPVSDPYKPHKVVIKGTTYITKLDRKTHKPVYKRKFSVSIPNVKNPPRVQTKEWRTSITKVNQDVENLRSEIRQRHPNIKKEKHLYSEVVQELFDQKIEECKKQGKSFETIEKYKSNNDKYVLNPKNGYPTLLNRNIEDISISEIKQLKNNIISYAKSNGLSKLTVSSIFTNLDRTFHYASESNYIDSDIAINSRITPDGAKPKQQVTLKNYLLKNEFDEMMLVFNKDFKFTPKETPRQTLYRKLLYKTFLECAFKLGFRKGEGMALKWKDYQDTLIEISNTLNTKGVMKHMNQSSRIINPKTESSSRFMKVPKTVRTCLDKWKEYCSSIGMSVSDDDFIFRELNGKPFNPSTFARRFQKIIDESNVEKKYNKELYPHSFLHSCCSFLIQMLRQADAEISLREIYIAVGKYLGHSSDKMVAQVYGHLYPDTEESLLNQVLELI